MMKDLEEELKELIRKKKGEYRRNPTVVVIEKNGETMKTVSGTHCRTLGRCESTDRMSKAIRIEETDRILNL
jgi:hypothetical protein